MLAIGLGVFGAIIVLSMIGMWRTYRTARAWAAVEAEDERLHWAERQSKEDGGAYDLDNMA